VLLLELMSIEELEETIELLRNKLFETASIKGFTDKRTLEISQSFNLYLLRYNKLKNIKSN
jgi:hypothetical protein